MVFGLKVINLVEFHAHFDSCFLLLIVALEVIVGAKRPIINNIVFDELPIHYSHMTVIDIFLKLQRFANLVRPL